MKKGMKIVATSLIAAALALVLAACGSQGGASQSGGSTTNQDQAKVTTAEYISAVQTGLENRWAQGDASDPNDLSQLKPRVQSEQDAVAQFQGREFEDSNLKSVADDYKQALDDCQAAINKSSAGDFNTAYNKRIAAIKTMVDSYGLTVSDQYSSRLDELVNGVPSLTVVDKKVTDHQYGYYDTAFTVRNDSNGPIYCPTLQLNELDASGNIVGTTSAQASTMVQPGQTIVLEGIDEESVASVQISGYWYFFGTDQNGTYVETTITDDQPMQLSVG
jgi:hypothetical protein